MNKRKQYKILVACPPLDGHFSPLTGLAKHLKENGHDVRWYTGPSFSDKLQKLAIPHYSYERVLEVNQYTMEELYPERKFIKSQIKNLEFSLIHIFLERAPEHFEDVQAIYKVFPFDALLCDSMFLAGRLTQRVMKVPTVAVGVVPLPLQQRDLAPYGMGLPPSDSLVMTVKYAIMRFMTNRFFFRKLRRKYNEINRKFGMPPLGYALFDRGCREFLFYLQSGVPGFDYRRKELPKNIHFVGALQPYETTSAEALVIDWPGDPESRPMILISQGTMEPDHSKLIIPALEGLKESPYFIVVVTAYVDTERLRDLYPQDNILIEDYIDFDQIMPMADVFVTNGGYGSVMQGIGYGLPMVCAGVHEEKNEICARVDHLKLGVNLKTESPKRVAIKNAVERVLSSDDYREAVRNVQGEFARYDTMSLCEQYIRAAVENPGTRTKKAETHPWIYRSSKTLFLVLTDIYYGWELIVREVSIG